MVPWKNINHSITLKKMTIAILYISLDLLVDINLFQTSKHLSSPVTLSMSCKEASPEAIGAVGKHSVVASCQHSQVSALVGLYIPHSCCVKEMTNMRYADYIRGINVVMEEKCWCQFNNYLYGVFCLILKLSSFPRLLLTQLYIHKCSGSE